MDKNALMTKQHDLMQFRADCLDAATKAFEGSNMTEYETQMAKVTDYNKQLEQLSGLIQECDKAFFVGQMEQKMGDDDRAHNAGIQLMDKVRGTEKYANAWLEAVRKGIPVEKGVGIESLAPLYEAESAMKALTIGGGSPAGADGGFLVPLDFDIRVREQEKDYVDLSALVTVEHVNVDSGWRVMDKTGTRTKLPKIAEMGKINEGQKPSFNQIKFNCEKYGDKLIVSNELLADAAGLIRYLADWWAPKFIMTKNDLILTLLNKVTFAAIAGTTAADQIKELTHMINTGLNTAHAKRAAILTNSFGYDVMDGWTDTTGRPMLVPDLKGGDFNRFKARPVHYADTDIVPDVTETEAKYNPIYVGDFKAYCAMFIRNGVRIKSTDIGGNAWDTDSTEIRCTCRMDCQQVDEAAVKRTGIKAVE